MKFSRDKFFQGFRDKIDETIEQEQVDGLEFLLGKMEADPFWKDIRHIAYALATAGHETAWSFQPVTEGYYLAKTDPPDYAGNTARVKRFQKTLRYYPYHGRGYVQLTWKKNYEKAGKILDMDMVNKPQLALEREGAYLTMTYGMHQGWFTGKKLTDYISDTGKDYKNARKIINGLDKAALIAGYANQFEEILRASKVSAAANATANQTEHLDKGINETANQSEQPSINIDNIEKANIEAPPPPPQSDPVTVKKEQVSFFAKIGATITAITGIGINAGSLIQSKLEAMTIAQIVYLVLALGLIALAVWWYQRAARGAQNRTLALMDKASDPSQNTIKLVDK